MSKDHCPSCGSCGFPMRKPEDFAGLVGHILTTTYLNGETIRVVGAVRLAPT